jgi:voltage-gated potassium channel
VNELRRRISILLDADRRDVPLGRAIDIFLIVLIIANVIAASVASMAGMRRTWSLVFTVFEIFSVVVFTIEYLLRLWSCVDRPKYEGLSPARARLKWALSPLGIIDLLAVLPFYVFLFYAWESQSALLLRVFRGMRLLRIFKLLRYSSSIQILHNVIREERGTLTVVAFILGMILVMASWGIYILEQAAQPEHFGSIPQSMWWAVVSLTTVGYGDVVPMTSLGKLFAGVIAVVGIAIAALPAGILASGFSSEIRRREHAYRRALNLAMSDGKISDHDLDRLEVVREELALSEEEAHSLYLDALRLWMKHTHCPHCGKSLHS